MTITVNQKNTNLAIAQTVARLKPCNISVDFDSISFVAILPAVQLINAANNSGKNATVTINIPTADISETFTAQPTACDFFHLWKAVYNNLPQENIKEQQQIRKQLFEIADNYAKPLTENEKYILRTYSAPYGLDMPKLEQTQSTVTDYIPRINSTFGGYADSNTQTVTKDIQQRTLQTLGHKQRLTETKRARQNLESILFYLENDIPFIDGWTTCKSCGMPKRTNRLQWHMVNGEPTPEEQPTLCQYCE